MLDVPLCEAMYVELLVEAWLLGLTAHQHCFSIVMTVCKNTSMHCSYMPHFQPKQFIDCNSLHFWVFWSCICKHEITYNSSSRTNVFRSRRKKKQSQTCLFFVSLCVVASKLNVLPPDVLQPMFGVCRCFSVAFMLFMFASDRFYQKRTHAFQSRSLVING